MWLPVTGILLIAFARLGVEKDASSGLQRIGQHLMNLSQTGNDVAHFIHQPLDQHSAY